MTTIKPPQRAPESLAACLGAAQREAERLHGDGPVRPWQPALDWRPWALAAALATVAAGALLWPRGREPPAEPPSAAAADPRVAMAPAEPTIPPRVADETVHSDAAPVAAPAAPPPTTEPRAPVPALPDNLEEWALDPQPLEPQTGETDAQTQFALANTPAIPDDQDPTPADESAPDEAAFEIPAD